MFIRCVREIFQDDGQGGYTMIPDEDRECLGRLPVRNVDLIADIYSPPGGGGGGGGLLQQYGAEIRIKNASGMQIIGHTAEDPATVDATLVAGGDICLCINGNPIV